MHIFQYCRKQSLQVEFDDQLLRMTELQQQYNFKCDEVEVQSSFAVVFSVSEFPKVLNCEP